MDIFENVMSSAGQKKSWQLAIIPILRLFLKLKGIESKFMAAK